MFPYEHIGRTLQGLVDIWFNGGHLGVGEWTPARIWQFTQSGTANNAKEVLAQISLVLSVVFGLILTVVLLKKRALLSNAALQTPQASATEGVPATASGGALAGRWQMILAHLDSPQEAQWKVAVIEADKLVDDALAQAGFAGGTFGDRLSNLQPGTLLSLEGLWWAHKIRNRLAHEVDYFLRYTEARQAISYYGATLEELHLV